MISFFKKNKVGCPFCSEKLSKEIFLNYKESEKFYFPMHSTKYQKTEIELYYETNREIFYKCRICNSIFYKYVNAYFKLNEYQIDTIKKWSQSEHKFSSELKNQIEKIGLTKFLDDYLLPCKITTIKNKTFDYVTLIMSKDLPILRILNCSTYFENFLFIDDIVNIEESEFGLSKEIRDYSISNNIKEVSKNFYPTIVKSKDDIELIFEGLTLFIKYENIKGKELELSKQLWDKKKQYLEDYLTKSQTLLIIRI